MTSDRQNFHYFFRVTGEKGLALFGHEYEKKAFKERMWSAL